MAATLMTRRGGFMRAGARFARVCLLLFTALWTAGAHPAAPVEQQPAPPPMKPASETAPTDCSTFLPYSSDPAHLWNRVHRRLLDRRDAAGKTWGCDEVDPLLWRESRHILTGDNYRETVRLLDEFTRTHAERLVRDPLRRAIFQHDLWAVFDWLAQRNDNYAKQRLELQRRLAAMIKAVALTPAEIEHLPANNVRDAKTADGLTLPGAAVDWLLLARDDAQPAAPIHATRFPRSVFLVYMHLPPGSPKNAAYLEQMRQYHWEHPRAHDCMLNPCSPPQFPVGTELALVRRALLIDDRGQPILSPITESIQLRRYLEIPAGVGFTTRGKQSAEFDLTRRALAEGHVDLRRVRDDDIQFPALADFGFDFFEGRSRIDFPRPGGMQQHCLSCHQGIGVISFATYSRAQMEGDPSRLFVLLHPGTESEETAAALQYLQSSESWKLLHQALP